MAMHTFMYVEGGQDLLWYIPHLYQLLIERLLLIALVAVLSTLVDHDLWIEVGGEYRHVGGERAAGRGGLR